MNGSSTVPEIAQHGENIGDREALIGPVAILALQKKTWSPLLLPGVLWRAISNLRTLFEVRDLLRLAPFRDVVRSNPRFCFKYLTHDYLARSFTVTTRASCFLYHHMRIYAVLPDPLHRAILKGDLTLHQFPYPGGSFLLRFGLARPVDCDKEGEIAIKLEVDGETVYLLSFTFVQGSVVGSTEPEVILISRIQGLPRCYPKIKRVTKALHDVAPAALLLAVAQGIALGFGVSEIVCVHAEDQSSYELKYDKLFKSAYDEFFQELGINQNDEGFFSTPVPITEKPLTMIKHGHKLRTKEKRAFKRAIMLECARYFADVCIDGRAKAAWWQETQ